METPGGRQRLRAAASPIVGLDGYLRVLTTWFKKHHGKTFEDLLGPVLVKEQRSVSAGHIVRISSLLQLLVDEGCVNASIYPSKFEMAVKQKLETDRMCTEKRSGIDIFCHDVTTHVRLVFGTLRIIKKEDHVDDCRGRRHPKTGALRRAASFTEWCIVQELLNKVELSSEGSSVSPRPACQSEPRQSSPSSVSKRSLSSLSVSKCSLVPSPASPCSQVECADADFSIFRTFLDKINVEEESLPGEDTANEEEKEKAEKNKEKEKTKGCAYDENDQDHVEKAESLCFDEDGFPLVEGHVPIVCPRPRERREQTLASRRSQRPEVSLSTPSKKPRRPSPEASGGKPTHDPDGVLTSIRISGPTKEKNPRTQVLASCGSNNRVFVCSLFKNTWGDDFDEAARMIAAEIEANGWTKAQALQYREQLRAKRRQ